MMGWCWVCHKWVWPWQHGKTPAGVLFHHKKCAVEATKRRGEYAEKWFGTEEEK